MCVCVRQPRRGIFENYLKTLPRRHDFIYVLAKLLAEIFIKFISNPHSVSRSILENFGQNAVQLFTPQTTNLYTHSRPAMRRMSNACWHTRMSKVSTLPHTQTQTHRERGRHTRRQRQTAATKQRPNVPRPLSIPCCECCDMPQSHPKCLLCVALNLLEFLLKQSRAESSRGEASPQHAVRLSSSARSHFPFLSPFCLPFPVIVLALQRKILPPLLPPPFVCLSHLRTNNFVNVPLSAA